MKTCPSCGTRFSEPVSFCPNDGTPTQEVQDAGPPVDPLLGRVIDGRYRVDKGIGEGGMGIVYLATHAVLGKRMALKVLRGEMAKDAEVVQRFMQEAQSATSIGHPNIIDISDFGRLPDGAVYFVMEYLDGESLSRMISRGGSIPTQTALHIVSQIAGALEAAHARGIVHRDLKPDNIYLVKQGSEEHFVKVLDFGIAKVGGANSKLTRTGMIFGTPHYMSPEQAAGQSVDNRTDIYALGVIMYEMFTGKVPFDGDTFMGILSKHMFEQPLPPSQVKGAGLGALEDVILKALAKKAEDRYQSMGDLVRDLDLIVTGGVIQIGSGGIGPPGNLADALEPPSRTEMRLGSAPSIPTSDSPPAKGRGLWVAVGFVALLALGGIAGGGAYLLAGMPTASAGTQPPVPPVTPVIATPPPSIPPVAPPVPDAVGAVIAPPTTPTTPVVAPVVASAGVEIMSDPPGAEVLIDGALIGSTPARLPRPSVGERGVTLRMAGYEDARIMITAVSPDSLSISLRRASGGGGHSHSTHTTAVATTPTTTTVAPPPPPPSHATSEVVDPWQ